jgi:hypothetical protein
MPRLWGIAMSTERVFTDDELLKRHDAGAAEALRCVSCRKVYGVRVENSEWPTADNITVPYELERNPSAEIVTLIVLDGRVAEGVCPECFTSIATSISAVSSAAKCCLEKL